MPTKAKGREIDELGELLGRSPVVILTDYRGLHVSELQALRKQLRGINAEYRVTKNTLLRIASERAGIPGLAPLLTGPTAAAFSAGDEIELTRALTDFARTSKILSVKGALLGRSVVDQSGIGQLAELPGREQLRANLVGAVNGPMAALVGSLQALLSSLVYALDQRADQLEEKPTI